MGTTSIVTVLRNSLKIEDEYHLQTVSLNRDSSRPTITLNAALSAEFSDEHKILNSLLNKSAN